MSLGRLLEINKNQSLTFVLKKTSFYLYFETRIEQEIQICPTPHTSYIVPLVPKTHLAFKHSDPTDENRGIINETY